MKIGKELVAVGRRTTVQQRLNLVAIAKEKRLSKVNVLKTTFRVDDDKEKKVVNVQNVDKDDVEWVPKPVDQHYDKMVIKMMTVKPRASYLNLHKR